MKTLKFWIVCTIHVLFSLVLFTSCEDCPKPVIPKITKQSDVPYFSYQNVLDYMTLKNVRLISAGEIIGMGTYILVFSDNQKCYITLDTYNKLF